MYEPGDVIEGVGEVQSNHCGAPWPVDISGNYAYGTVAVRTDQGNIVMCDAITGEALLDIERLMATRRGNTAYDYDRRARDNKGRRYPGNERVEVVRSWSGIRQWWYFFRGSFWHNVKEFFGFI